MDLILLRLAQRLVLPPTNILLIVLFGFLLLRSCRKLGRLLIVAGFLLLYGLSISPVSNALINPLEMAFKPVNVKYVKADVIVVLGGGAHDLSWLGLEPEPGEGSLQRAVAAVKLYRALHIPIMITGGAGNPAQPRVNDAEAIARAALELGVPRKDLILDNRSPNTLASARAVKRQLAGKRIILVTAAYHLKRSMAMFKTPGLDVIPGPSGYLRGQMDGLFYAVLPSMDALRISTIALSEHMSYLFYKIKRDI